MATFTPSTDTTSYAGQFSPSANFYLNKKWGLWSGTANDEGTKGVADTLNDINRIISYKGGSQISDISQLDSALSPLIAKRNAGGFKNTFGSIAKVALPIALSFIPGFNVLGAAIGSGIGLGSGTAAAMAGNAILGAGTSGLTSALTGGKVLKDAITGGLTAGATSGLSNALGSGSQVLATSGPLKGQLVTPGVSSTLATSGPMAGQLVTPSISAANITGQGINSGTSMSGIGTSISGYDPDWIDQGASMLARTNQKVSSVGDQITSALGLPATNSAAAAGTTAGGTGNMSRISGSNPLVSAITGWRDYQAQSDIEDQLKQGQTQALNTLNPYLSSGYAANQQLSDALKAGFDPSGIESDSGYQFRLSQGNKQLQEAMAAQGMGQSGAALKAATEYGQNFAKNEVADAYSRWLSQNQLLANQASQGANVAGAVGDIQTDMGNVGANATVRKNNAINNTLSVLMGRGVIGWDNNGNPIYG